MSRPSVHWFAFIPFLLYVSSMKYQFPTYEEACLFAAEKQSEGYFSEVLHVQAGHFWGAQTTHGFSVIVSETEIDCEPPADVDDSEALNFVRLIIAAAIVLGGAALTAFLGLIIFSFATSASVATWVSLAIAAALFTLGIALTIGAVKAFRSERSRFHLAARIFFALLSLGLGLMLFTMSH